MKPRLASIVWTDWPALFCALMIPAIWLIGLALPLFRESASFGAFEMLVIAAPISSLSAGVLVWRILRIFRFFARGYLTTARITELRTAKDRGRLFFAYAYGSRQLNAWTPVHKTKQVKALEVGQEVEVLVDREKPESAIVRHLYL